MKIEYDDITASVYTVTKGGVYWVTLKWGNTGMFTHSFTVRTSPKFPEKGLWVQPPKFQPKWESHFEFAGDSDLWLHIQDLCREAVKAYGDPMEALGVTQPEDSSATMGELLDFTDEQLSDAFDKVINAENDESPP